MIVWEGMARVGYCVKCKMNIYHMFLQCLVFGLEEIVVPFIHPSGKKNGPL